MARTGALEVLPHVRPRGLVLAEGVVVGERVAEEMRTVDAAFDQKKYRKPVSNVKSRSVDSVSIPHPGLK